MELLRVFKLLYHKRFFLVLSSILAGVLAYLVIRNDPETYKSTAQIATGYTMRDKISFGEDDFSLRESDVKFRNLIQTFNSPLLLANLSYRLLKHDLEEGEAFRKPENLVKDPTFNNDKFIALLETKINEYQLLDPTDIDEKFLIQLLRTFGYTQRSLNEIIMVNRLKLTDYIEIIAKTENPYLSSFIVNELINVYIDYDIFQQSRSSGESLTILKNIVAQKKNDLDEKSNKLKDYKSDNRVYNYEVESTLKFEQLNKLEPEIQQIRREIRALELELKSIDDKINIGGKSTINNDILEVKKKMDGFNQDFTLSGSDNPRLLDSLQKYQNLYQKLIKNQNSNKIDPQIIENRAEVARKLQLERENLSINQQQYYALRRSLGGFASKEAEIEYLEKEVTLATQEYLNAQEKYNQALDVIEASSKSIRVIMKGHPATEPESNKTLFKVALAGASVFFLLSLIFIIIDYTDISIRSPYNFKRLFDFSLIGVLSLVKFKNNNFQNIWESGKNKFHPTINDFRDQIKNIRYNITTFDKKIILFSSLKVDSGKATIVHNLGISLSTIGKKTLVIDLNFKNNKLSNLDSNTIDVIKVVNSGEFDRVLHDNKTKSSYGYSFLGNRGSFNSPVELFDNVKLTNFLTHAKNHFDYILIESSSLEKHTDSKELFSFVDGIILVMSSEDKIGNKETEIVNSVKEQDNKFLGCILNKVNRKFVDE